MREVEVKILAMGDICLKKKRNNDLIDSELQTIFQNYDLITCDLGVTLSNADAPKSLKVGPYEQQTPDCVKMCRNIGINMVRLAGNHIMDFGVQGMLHLEEELRRNHIEYIGVSGSKEDAYHPFVWEIKGMRIACFSAGEMCFGYSDGMEEQGYAWINSYQLEERIREVRDKVDWVILFAHAGLENVPIPLEEWRYRYRALIDMGVDFVIATHAHIVQGIEEYGNGIIAYGLGNCAYDMDVVKNRDRWDTSIAISLTLSNEQKFTYDVIPLKYEKQTVKVNRKDFVFEKQFEYAMKVLKDRKLYSEEIKRECLEYFECYYFDYYIRNAVKLDGVIDYAFLWHNIAIETQLYMTRKALSELMHRNPAGSEISFNLYENQYVMWGYGKVGKLFKEYLDNKGIQIIGIVDESLQEGGGVISKERLVNMLKEDKNIIVIISTITYYQQISDYLFENLKRRQYIDFQHFMAKVQQVEFNRQLEQVDV